MEYWKKDIISSLKELLEYDLCYYENSARFSLDEIICQLFDDTGLSDILENQIIFNKEVDGKLIELSEMIDLLNLNEELDLLLKSDLWLNIKERIRNILEDIQNC